MSDVPRKELDRKTERREKPFNAAAARAQQGGHSSARNCAAAIVGWLAIHEARRSGTGHFLPVERAGLSERAFVVKGASSAGEDLQRICLCLPVSHPGRAGSTCKHEHDTPRRWWLKMHGGCPT